MRHWMAESIAGLLAVRPSKHMRSRAQVPGIHMSPAPSIKRLHAAVGSQKWNTTIALAAITTDPSLIIA